MNTKDLFDFALLSGGFTSEQSNLSSIFGSIPSICAVHCYCNPEITLGPFYLLYFHLPKDFCFSLIEKINKSFPISDGKSIKNLVDYFHEEEILLTQNEKHLKLKDVSLHSINADIGGRIIYRFREFELV